MIKYLALAKATFEEYFVYRTNFLLWRVRAVLQLAVLFFLWSAAFGKSPVIFGYTQAQMLTYVLGISLIRSYILAARLSAGVGAEIVTGNLTNIILKPISYLRYVFSRDLSDKAINIFFSSLELVGFMALFRPQLVWQTEPVFLLATVASVLLALLLYFLITMTISYTAFWLIDDWWAPAFVFGIVVDFLAGGIFPIDILPPQLAKVLLLTPFPYILYFPLKVYLGQLSHWSIFGGLAVLSFWVGIAYILQKVIWNKGMHRYEAVGR